MRLVRDLHVNGTYSNVQLDDASRDMIVHLMTVLKLDNPTLPHKLHSTVIYSRKPCPDAMDHHNSEICYRGRIANLEKFPTQTGGNCLVALVECEDLVNLNRHFTETYGATSDYPEYRPHITLCYECGDDDYELPDVIDVTFNKIIVEPLETID